jgi:hypothetical protein
VYPHPEKEEKKEEAGENTLLFFPFPLFIVVSFFLTFMMWLIKEMSTWNLRH